MIVLVILGGILLYLVLGAVFIRFLWLMTWEQNDTYETLTDEDKKAMAIAFAFWPIVLVLLVIVGLSIGIWELVKMWIFKPRDHDKTKRAAWLAKWKLKRLERNLRKD